MDIADIGNLRADMEMHQLQQLEFAGIAQNIDGLQYLSGGEAKFAFFTTGILPFAFADRV